MVSIRDCVHSGLCPFGIVSIRDCVHSGLCPFGIVSIRDCVHSGLCPFGMVSLRDCVHSGWCPFGIVYRIRVHYSIITSRAMMSKLRSNSRITINGCMFLPILDVPFGKLPPSKNVVDRLLAETNFKSQMSFGAVADELIEIWTWCNVYTLSKRRIVLKIKSLVDTFDRYFLHFETILKVIYPKCLRNGQHGNFDYIIRLKTCYH